MSLISVEKARLDCKPPSFFTLLIVIAFASINAVFYTPGLPAIQEAFKVSASDAKMTMTVFLFGYAFGQLIYGPLANRFGRKPALYIGIAITLVGNLMCGFSGLLGSFGLLLSGRLVIALGASAGLTMTLAIITDYYYQRDARKIIAYATLGFAAVPGISIAVGGGLIDLLGWASAFWGMVAYAGFAGVLVARLPETGRDLHPHATKIKQIARRYIHVFRDSVLIRYSLIAGLATALIYVFATGGPFIAIGRFGIGEAQYGLYYLIISLGLVLGGFFTGRAAHRIEARRMMGMSVAVLLIGLLGLAALLLSSTAQPVSFFVVVAFAFLALSPIYSNATALATSQTDDKATASSAVSFLNMGTTVLVVLAYGLLPGKPGVVLPFVLLGLALLITLLFYATRHCQDNPS